MPSTMQHVAMALVSGLAEGMPCRQVAPPDHRSKTPAPLSSACVLHWSLLFTPCRTATLQLESLDGELNSTRSAAQQQIAQARKEAASAVSAARQAAADGGAQSLAHAAEREAALQRQAAELCAELDVSLVSGA